MTPQKALDHLHKYPYDISVAIEALSLVADLDDPALPELYARVAAALPSRQAVEDLMGDRAELMTNFYPVDETPEPSTEDTIDTFLSTFGPADADETALLNKVLFSGTPSMEATLFAESQKLDEQAEQTPQSEEDKLISQFIGSHKEEPKEPESDILTNKPKAVSAPAPQPDSASLTTSFVKILIKNRNYSKALEIISEINLKNPEKSIYFADQIRFLKKLIINENKK